MKFFFAQLPRPTASVSLVGVMPPTGLPGSELGITGPRLLVVLGAAAVGGVFVSSISDSGPGKTTVAVAASSTALELFAFVCTSRFHFRNSANKAKSSLGVEDSDILRSRELKARASLYAMHIALYN